LKTVRRNEEVLPPKRPRVQVEVDQSADLAAKGGQRCRQVGWKDGVVKPRLSDLRRWKWRRKTTRSSNVVIIL
jgi:hypothetical protein